MTESERKTLREFISARQEIVFERLSDHPRYLEVCEQQDQTEQMVEALLVRFEKADRIAVRRHYEGEIVKTHIEHDEMYIQGLRDSVRILSLLGVFSMEL